MTNDNANIVSHRYLIPLTFVLAYPTPPKNVSRKHPAGSPYWKNHISGNGSLADPIRRDILRRLIDATYTIGQIAANYNVSFAAVAKHLHVLEKAKLIIKTRRGKEQVVSIAPDALRDASYYLKQYEALWNARLDALDQVLKEID